MSVQQFESGIKRTAADMDSLRGVLRRALVTSVNMSTMEAKVTYQPSGQPSGWLPILVQFGGAGWGEITGLQNDALVAVMAEDGEAEHGVIIGRYYSQVDPPPQGAGQTERWFVHQSGSFLKLKDDGSISSSGTWNHVGNFILTGGDVTADGTSLKNHLTSEVTAGIANSGPPVPGT